MARNSLTTFVFVVFLAAGFAAHADTFKNKETGEVFYGFRTTKVSGSKTLVYNEADKKMSPIDLSGYEVVLDEKGRRNSAVQVAITNPEILLSSNVAEIVAEAIVKAANTGPRFVLLKIDNPGGRGENMKTICTAITSINTCPIVAYISGGTYGGAHSAAAAVAIACDKIYIAPSASMSAVGPFVGTANGLSEVDFIKMYSPDSLASYGTYISTLAEAKHRPSLLARGFVDKKVGMVEVTDTNGAVSIVEKNLRLPSQTVVKTLCEGASTDAQTTTQPSDQAAATAIHSQILNLSPAEAVRLKLVDGIADSIQAVMADMGAPDAAIANAPGIDTVVKQFAAAKRAVGQSLARISFLENRASTLENQINTLEEQLRTNPTTRSQTRGKDNRAYSRSRNSIYNDSYYYYDEQRDRLETQEPLGPQSIPGRTTTTTSDGRPITSRRNPSRYNESETRTVNEAPEGAIQAKQELYMVLNELVGEYQRTIATAKRWGGVLPPELSIQSMQSDMESAIALANSLDYR